MLTINGKALPVRLPGGGFSGGSATAAGVGSALLSNPGVSLWDSSDQSMKQSEKGKNLMFMR
jgi:hypothetical protein